jgi:hypothetical protein
MKKIRKDLESVRMMVDLMRKREKAKLELFNLYLMIMTPQFLTIKIPRNFMMEHPEIFAQVFFLFSGFREN